MPRTTAHLAARSWPWHVTHVAIFVDGAVGFVLLSGVVVGMTQHRTIDRAGLRAGQRKLLRRNRLIYAAHIGLCGVAFAALALEPTRSGRYLGEPGGPVPAVLATLTLRVNQPYTSILSLYVVLLALTVAAVAALAVRLPALVVAGSIALFVRRAFTEGFLAPGTVLMAFAAVLVGYRICRRLIEVAGSVVGPIAVIGRHSLDCYLILNVTVIVLPSVFVY